jgi:hypothetical protein
MGPSKCKVNYFLYSFQYVKRMQSYTDAKCGVMLCKISRLGQQTLFFGSAPITATSSGASTTGHMTGTMPVPQTQAIDVTLAALLWTTRVHDAPEPPGLQKVGFAQMRCKSTVVISSGGV